MPTDLLPNAKSRRWDNLLLDDRPPTRRELKLRSLRGRSEMGRIERYLELMERSGLKRRSGLSHKAVSLASGSAIGEPLRVYASVAGNVDHQDDMIVPGAVANVDEFIRSGVVLLCHNTAALPIGWVADAVQDDHGLLVTPAFHSTPEAEAAQTVIRERLDAGKAVGASIGYEILEYRHAEIDGRRVRVIESMNVFELSFVNIPANPLAGVIA